MGWVGGPRWQAGLLMADQKQPQAHKLQDES